MFIALCVSKSPRDIASHRRCHVLWSRNAGSFRSPPGRLGRGERPPVLSARARQLPARHPHEFQRNTVTTEGPKPSPGRSRPPRAAVLPLRTTTRPAAAKILYHDGLGRPKQVDKGGDTWRRTGPGALDGPTKSRFQAAFGVHEMFPGTAAVKAATCTATARRASALT